MNPIKKGEHGVHRTFKRVDCAFTRKSVQAVIKTGVNMLIISRDSLIPKG